MSLILLSSSSGPYTLELSYNGGYNFLWPCIQSYSAPAIYCKLIFSRTQHPFSPHTQVLISISELLVALTDSTKVEEIRMVHHVYCRLLMDPRLGLAPLAHIFKYFYSFWNKQLKALNLSQQHAQNGGPAAVMG